MSYGKGRENGFDTATSAWWRCSKWRSTPQRLHGSIRLYSLKI